MVTDDHYVIHVMNNGDVVANWAARKAFTQIRNAATNAVFNREVWKGGDLKFPKEMKITAEKIRCDSF